jgi:hypothetical protein
MQLAQFMREMVSVPYSFAMLETAGKKRPQRMYKAATVLRASAQHLSHWSDPPTVSAQGREVFYAYARNLVHHVGRLEASVQEHDTEVLVDSLEQIRQTCNNCHRYFRPASRLSSDVLFDHFASELGAPP